MIVVIGGLIVSMVLGLRNAVDVDVWLHLRIGDELRGGTEFGTLPDPLVLIADRPYIPTQWLGEVVLSGVYELWGFAGIHALRVVGLCLLIGIVYLTTRLFARPVPAAGITLAAVLATSGAWGERPQFAGVVFAAAAVLLWAHAWTRLRVPWWILPLVWLWACVHGSWILGIGLGVLFTVAMLMKGPAGRGLWRRLVLVNCLSLVLVALTPLGPQLLAAPLVVGVSARGAVAEWQVPSWTNPLLLLVLAMVAAAVPGTVRRPDRAVGLLLGLVALLLAATAVRTIAFGAILAAPACAAAWAARSDERRAQTGDADRGVTGWMAAVVGLLLTGTAVLDPPKTDPLDAGVATSMAQLESGAHVAVPRRLSNWVLHKYPELVPLQDLRAEVYSEPTAAAYASFIRAEDGWRRYATDHDVRALVVEANSQMAKALQGVSDWRHVASEDDYQMWVASVAGPQ